MNYSPLAHAEVGASGIMY